MCTNHSQRMSCMAYCRVAALFLAQLVPLSVYAAHDEAKANRAVWNNASSQIDPGDADTSPTHYLRYGNCVFEVRASQAAVLGLADGVVLSRLEAVELQTRFDRELAVQARLAVSREKLLAVVRSVYRNPVNKPQFDKTISEQQVLRRVEGNLDAGRPVFDGVLQRGSRVAPADIHQRIVEKLDLLQQRERYLAEMHDYLESIGHIA